MFVGIGGKVGHARNAVMRERTAQFFLGNVGVCHSLYHVRTGNEHVRRVLHHDVEICDRGAIDSATRAGTHDATNLRHDAARQSVAQKDICVATQTYHAFLNASAAGIIQANNGYAYLHRQVENFANFFGMSFREGTAEDGKVLRKHNHPTAIDETVTRDDAVAGIELLFQTKVLRAMDDELVKLFKAVLVKQKLHALPRGHFVGSVLLLNSLDTATRFRLQRALPQEFKLGPGLPGLLL